MNDSRTEPHDIAAEQGVLGMLLYGVPVAETGLTADDFYRPAHQLIYEAMTRLSAERIPCDPVTVADDMRRHGTLGRVPDGASYLHTCQATPMVRGGMPHYADILRDLAKRRDLMAEGRRIQQRAQNPSEDVTALAQEMRATLDGTIGPETGPGPRVVHLDQLTAEYVRWLWPGYLPLGKVVVLDGDPGVGKSAMVVDLAARVSTGKPMPDGSPAAKGTVLVLSCEDGLTDTIIPRLHAAGADMGQVKTITDIGDVTQDGNAYRRDVTIPRDVAHIEGVVKRYGVVLVVVDVLMGYLTGNSHKDQEVRQSLRPVADMADRTGCCVVALRHLNKGNANAPAVYRGGGSIGIVGAARMAFMCGADPDDDTGEARVLAPVKCNLAKEPPALSYRLVTDHEHGCVRVQWGGVSDHRANTLLAEPLADEDKTERDEAVDWLVSYLTENGGEARAGDVIKDAQRDGIAKTTLTRARKRAGVTTAKAGFGGGWVWQLDPRRIHEESEEPRSRGLGSSVPSVDSSGDGDRACLANLAPEPVPSGPR